MILIPTQLAALSGRKLDQDLLTTFQLYAEQQADLAVERFLDILPASTMRDNSVFLRWRKLIRKIARDQPSNLLPILGLYARVHERHLAEGNPKGAVRFLKEIEALTEEYARVSGEPDAKTCASRLLTHVALNVRDLESLFYALPLLQRAIELDEQNLVAHLVQINLLEKRGRYNAAVLALDRLLKVEPGHAEARLRRAIVQGKRGQTLAAIELLAAITEEVDQEWIRLLAFQERARLLTQEGRIEDAISGIDLGLRHFPDDERLRLQRTFLTYATLPSTREQIAELAGRPWPARIAPRLRYNNWPDRQTKQLREQLAADIVERLPALDQTLEPFR